MAIWNESDCSSDLVLSNNFLTATNTPTSSWGGVRATITKASGKWYWEIEIDDESIYHAIGVATSSHSLEIGIGYSTTAGWGYWYNGKKYYNSASGVAFGATYTVGDIVGVAIDIDAGKIWFAKNNAWQDSGDPGAGTGEAFSGLAGTLYPIYANKTATAAGTAYFNGVDQTYAPPAGFSSFLSATNLLDGKALIKDSAINLLDGRTAISPCTTQLDGKAIIKDVTTNLLDGKAMVRDSVTNLLDGKGRIKDSATNLLDSRTWIVYTGQIDDYCPTPTCDMSAVFRYARIDAIPPVPEASFTIGKIIAGDSPVPDFTCIAYHGRNSSLVANSPCPTCSMRVGLILSDIATISRKAGVPVPTCIMSADTHHLVTIYGDVPCPVITCDGDTVNITVISASAPVPTGIFETTIGNIASILGRSPCPSCSLVALTGQVISLAGSVPVPGSLVRFYASLKNETITLAGTVPTPLMISKVHGLTSSVLRHIRGEIR